MKTPEEIFFSQRYTEEELKEAGWEERKEDTLMSMSDLADDGDWDYVFNRHIYPSMIEFGKQCARKAFNAVLFECNVWNEDLDPNDLLKQIEREIDDQNKVQSKSTSNEK